MGASQSVEQPSIDCKASPDAICTMCADEDQDQKYCERNGWKQQVRCIETKAEVNRSYLGDEATGYLTYQPCPVVPGDFLGFVKFELLMLLCFAASFTFVQKRKRRHQLIMLNRIDTYL